MSVCLGRCMGMWGGMPRGDQKGHMWSCFKGL